LSCEFRIFRHIVTIFRNLVIFRMSYLHNQMRSWKPFFTFKFFSEYSFKIANLLYGISWKLCFTVSLLTSFLRQNTVKIKNPKTYDCWEYKVLQKLYYRAKFQLKRLKIRLKEITSWWQLTPGVTRASTSLYLKLEVAILWQQECKLTIWDNSTHFKKSLTCCEHLRACVGFCL